MILMILIGIMMTSVQMLTISDDEAQEVTSVVLERIGQRRSFSFGYPDIRMLLLPHIFVWLELRILWVKTWTAIRNGYICKVTIRKQCYVCSYAKSCELCIYDRFITIIIV